MYFVWKSVLTLVSFAFLLATRADAGENPPLEKPAELKPDAVARKAFAERDDDGNGNLGVGEFVRHAPRGDEAIARRDFRLVDLDHDGELCFEEFRNIPYLVPPAERGSFPDPVVGLVEDHFKNSERTWEQSDADRDGRLSFNEFRPATSELLPPPVVTFRIWAAAWRQLDGDRDGFATRDEWRTFLEVWYGVRQPQGELLRAATGIVANWMHFKHLDRNHDDRVDHQEFVKWGSDGDMAEKRFAETDKDHDSAITFVEWAERELWQVNLFSHFCELDKNLDARIDHDELLKTVPDWQKSVARHMFPGFDSDRDGFLSMDEFALTPLYNQLDFWHDMREDRDADGRLSFAEFQRDEGPSLLGLTVEFFRRLDVNRDGELDHNEWSFHTPEPPMSRLYMANADGSAIELLADVGLFDATFLGSPEWSHDGKTIAFDATPATGIRCDFSRSRIATVSVTGKGKREIAELGFGNCPDWSPDDNQIAFFLNPGNPEGGQPGVWVMNADGTERHSVAPNLWYPRWSRDGRSLLCHDSSSPKKYFLVDSETGRRRQVLRKVTALGLPCWDPGGNLLCVTLHLADHRQLCLVNLAGDPDSIIELWKGEALLAQQLKGSSDTSRPDWSADGLEIVFSDNSSGKCVLKRVATTGDEPAAVVAPALTHNDVHAVWSPDRKRIAFTSSQPPHEIPDVKLPPDR